MRPPAVVLVLAALILAHAFGGVAVAQTETEVRNRALVAEKFDAWASRTGSPFDLLADDAAWTITGRSDAAGTYPSREAFMSAVIRPFNARMREGLKPAIRSLLADGDTVVVHFDAAGVARDGTPYENTYAWFMEMRDGRIVRVTAFYDALAFNDLWRRVAP